MNGDKETHDPAFRSWVESANAAGADFPVQNLPFGAFRRRGSNEAFRGGVAIGTEILDLGAAHKAGAFSGEAAAAAANCAGPTLNAFMAMGPRAWSALRLALSRALRDGSPLEDKLRACLVPQAAAEHAVPAEIGDYTDFYASVHHATTVGKHVPPGQPAAAELQVGADRLPRPRLLDRRERHSASRARSARRLPPGATEPAFGPCRRLDYELEVGVYVGVGNALGERVPVARGRVARRSGCASSTTGRRATSRPGSTSRSDRSSRRASRRRSRRGS